MKKIAFGIITAFLFTNNIAVEAVLPLTNNRPGQGNYSYYSQPMYEPIYIPYDDHEYYSSPQMHDSNYIPHHEYYASQQVHEAPISEYKHLQPNPEVFVIEFIDGSNLSVIVGGYSPDNIQVTALNSHERVNIDWKQIARIYRQNSDSIEKKNFSVGKAALQQKKPGAMIANAPSDISLIGEEIIYDPKKKIRDEDSAEDNKKQKEQEILFSANGYLGATENIVAMAGAIKPDYPHPLKHDAMQDDHGYYLKPKITSKDVEQIPGMIYIEDENIVILPTENKAASIEPLVAFYIDKFPVRNKEYLEFIEESHHKAPKHWVNGVIPQGKESQPITNISYNDAVAYAEWAGKRLPTHVEWQRACDTGMIKTTENKVLLEWTATPFTVSNISNIEDAWIEKYKPTLQLVDYRVLVAKEKPLKPMEEKEAASNIGFRTVKDVR